MKTTPRDPPFPKFQPFDADPRFSQLLPFHPLFMRFEDEKFEAQFRDAFFENFRKANKKSVPVGLFVWVLWFVLDYAVSADSFPYMALSRACGTVIGVVVYVWTTILPVRLSRFATILLWSFTCISFGTATAFNTCINGSLSTSGTITLVVAVNVFVNLPFFAFLRINFIFPIVYFCILKFFGNGSQSLVMDNSLFVFSTSMILAINAYSKEVHFRREFRLTQMMLQQWQLRAEEALELSRVSRLAADAKSRFLAVMSHEMRGPLNGIHAMTELLSRSELNADDMESVVIIQRSSELLLALISDVLDVSRFETNAIKLAPEQVDVFELVEDVLSLCESEVYKHDQVELFAKFVPGIPRSIYVDKNRLKQIILNLAWNAVKFCHKGFVSLEVSLCENLPENPPQDCTYAINYPNGERCATGPALVISVQDTGVGISAEDLPNVFQEFWQKDTSATRKYNGAGLGLSICKRLTEAMKGQLSASSSPDAPGSTFVVYLPLSNLRVPTREPMPGSLDIVVIDDSDSNIYSSPFHSSSLVFRGDVKMFDTPGRPLSFSSILPSTLPKLAIFINRSFEAAAVVSNYLTHYGYKTLMFKNLAEMRATMSEREKDQFQVALVFLDSNTSKNALVSLHRAMGRPNNKSSISSSSGSDTKLDIEISEIMPVPRRARRQSFSAPPSFQPGFSFPAPGPYAPFFPYVYIYVTSTSHRVHTDDLLSCGFSLQLTKPVKMKSLVKAINLGDEIVTANLLREDGSAVVVAPLVVSSEVEESKQNYLMNEPGVTQKSPNPSIFHAELQASSPRHARPPSLPRIPIRVLVVDDNPINVRVIQKMLAGDRYHIYTAKDGLEAIESVDENDPYDLILMDMHMPNVGGVEATSRIRGRSDSKKNVPIVALSADVFQETLDEAFKAGVTEFLTKPVKIQELSDAIQRLVPAAAK